MSFIENKQQAAEKEWKRMIAEFLRKIGLVKEKYKGEITLHPTC